MELTRTPLGRAFQLSLLCGAIAGTALGAGVEVTTQAASEGTFGLQVNLGPDCASAQDLVLDGDDAPLEGTYEACRTITVESLSMTTGSATLRAGDRIELREGFQVHADANLTLVTDAALNGGPTYVQDTSPIDEDVYTARFSARFDDIALATGDRIEGLAAYSADWETIFRVAVEPDGSGGFQLALEALQDGGGMVQTPPGEEIAVSPGWNIIELEWNAGPGDGQLRLSVNGDPLQGLIDLDNGASRIESIRLGGVGGAVFDATGSMQLDSYSSTR